MRCVAQVLAGAILLLTQLQAEAADPKRVLLLHSFGAAFAPWSVVAGRFREELIKQSPTPIDLYEASLVTARFKESEEDESSFAEYLGAVFTERKPDLVVVNGGPANRFFQRYRRKLFPITPLLIMSVEERNAVLAGNEAVVPIKIPFPDFIADILQLLPQTVNIAVAVGDSPLERVWTRELKRGFERFNDRVKFEWLNGLPFGDMQKRVEALGPNSAVFYMLLVTDGHGVPHEQDRALSALHAVTKAPIFSHLDSAFGLGIVGGAMIPAQEHGRQAAVVAVRILGGENPDDIKTPPLAKGTPTYDARELQRWGISESRLPPGSIIAFRDPTLWERYRWQLVGVFMAMLLQSAMITALLFQRAQRRIAEETSIGLSGRLLTAHEDERKRLARELHDDLTQRLARLAIDAGRLEQGGGSSHGAATAMRNELARLSEDVHALSYRLHPSVLDDLGLVEALRSECDRVARDGAMRVEVDARSVPPNLPSEISLCLFRVAQEALSNAARHAHASAVTVLLSPRGKGLQLAVSDNGDGFDHDGARNRASLGLASMNERVRLLSGELNVESTPGRGTTVVAWVPA